MSTHLAASLVLTMAVFWVLLHLAIGQAVPIQMSLSPRVSRAPASWLIQVRVQARNTDDWVGVAADGPDFYRRSDWLIDRNRVLYMVEWRDIPAGEYEVSAMIGQDNQIRASARLTAIVVGLGHN